MTVRTKIFKKAIALCKTKKVKYLGFGRESLYFQVFEQNVEIGTMHEGTTLSCSCQHCSLYPDALCMHKLAVLYHYMTYKKTGGDLKSILNLNKE